MINRPVQKLCNICPCAVYAVYAVYHCIVYAVYPCAVYAGLKMLELFCTLLWGLLEFSCAKNYE